MASLLKLESSLHVILKLLLHCKRAKMKYMYSVHSKTYRQICLYWLELCWNVMLRHYSTIEMWSKPT